MDALCRSLADSDNANKLAVTPAVPVQLSLLIEEAKHDVRKPDKQIQDKQIQIGLHYRRASDWSKAKKGEPGRGLTLQRLLDVASEQRPFAIALLRRCLAVLEAQELAAQPNTDRELEEVITKAQRLIDVVRQRQLLKAGLTPSSVATRVSA